MPHFVSHDKADLVFGKFVDGGVPEDDAARAAESDDVGVQCVGVFAFIDLIDSTVGNPRLVGKRGFAVPALYFSSAQNR